MSRVPVIDSSAYIGLSDIGALDLLPKIYGKVIVPAAVRAEIIAGDPSDDPTIHPWVDVVDAIPSPAIKTRLGAGEVAVISVALERPELLAVIDDNRGRSEAARLGVTRTGVLGVLVAAKTKGLIPAIGPLIQALHDLEPPFFMAPGLIARVLIAAGEDPASVRLKTGPARKGPKRRTP